MIKFAFDPRHGLVPSSPPKGSRGVYEDGFSNRKRDRLAQHVRVPYPSPRPSPTHTQRNLVQKNHPNPLRHKQACYHRETSHRSRSRASTSCREAGPVRGGRRSYSVGFSIHTYALRLESLNNEPHCGGLHRTFSTLTVRLARLTLNAFLESVDLIIRTIGEFGEEAERRRS